jgi:hypothetical protein
MIPTPDDILRSILATQPAIERLVVPAAPGAGKSGTAERLAIQGMGVHGERVVIACNTNSQAQDLARRLAEGWPRLAIHLFTKNGLRLEDATTDVIRRTGLVRIQRNGDIPTGPCIVVATAKRLSWLDMTASFDLGIVDEAYQLPNFGFIQISGVMSRVVLVGDPGQIAPIVIEALERWRCDAAGPHVPAPDALLTRHPQAVHVIQMPITRRLLQDTVDYVQPAFYPTLPFRSIVSSSQRSLSFAAKGVTKVDRALDRIAGGESLLVYELLALVTGEHDPELATTIAAMVNQLLGRGATVQHPNQPSAPLAAREVGVVAAHRSQVALLSQLLAHHPEVVIETADRYQGLERDLMIVWHPLSGRSDVSEFHLDAGRACVATTRHRLGCILVTRAGIRQQLARHVLVGVRALGVERDAEWAGHQAQRQLLDRLDANGRIIAA